MLTKNSKRITIALIFIFFFIIAFYTPLTGDDWAWATNEGIQRLKEGFHMYNGRYAGNITEIILTRAGIIRPLVMALIMTYIIVKMVQLTNKKVILYGAGFLLILLMPIIIFQQTISWTAGYTNYVVPIAIFVTYLVDLKRIMYEDYQPSRLKIAIMFILAIIGQLFVEHMTLYIFIATIFVFIYYYVKNKKINHYLLWYMLGSIIGLIIMFSNGTYIYNLTHKDYRRIGAENNDSLIVNAIHVYIEPISRILVYTFSIVNVIIASLLAKHAKKISFLNYISLAITFLFITNQMLIHIPIRAKIVAVLSVIMILVNFYLIFKTQLSKVKIGQIAFLYMSAYAVIAPLLVVNPFGYRNFVFSYFLFIIIILIMIEDFTFTDFAKKAIVTLSVVLALQYGYYFFKNNAVNEDRLTCLKKQAKNETDTYYVTTLPYEQFLWASVPQIDIYKERFMEYHHLKPKKHIKLIKYDKYRKIKKRICK